MKHSRTVQQFVVNVSHDFLTKEEVEDILNESAGYTFKSAQTVEDLNDASQYADGSVALQKVQLGQHQNG